MLPKPAALLRAMLLAAIAADAQSDKLQVDLNSPGASLTR